MFRAPLPFLAALREWSPPTAVVLDWRLEHELSAALFLATRHRYPTPAGDLLDRAHCRRAAVDDHGGCPDDRRRQGRRDEPFERALDWASGLVDDGVDALGAPEREDGVHAAEAERGRQRGIDARATGAR